MSPQVGSQRLPSRTALALLGLTLLAIGGNQLELSPFFGLRLQLGSIAAVFALLRYGWWGLTVGVATALVSAQLRGVPAAAIIYSLELLWLQLYLVHLNGGKRNADNGRLLLADIGYWLVVGLPLATFLFGRLATLEQTNLLTIALGQAVNSVINTTIGFTLFLAAKHWFPRLTGVKGVSIRGITMGAMLLAITIPALLITSLHSRNLQGSVEQGQFAKLGLISSTVASLRISELAELSASLPKGEQRIDIQRLDLQGNVFETAPELFRQLERNDQPAEERATQRPGLTLLLPPKKAPLTARLMEAYWLRETRIHHRHPLTPDVIIRVVEPARSTVLQLQRQSLESAALLAWVILIGSLLSEWLSRSLDGQFSKVMAPIFRHQARAGAHDPRVETSYTMPTLATSFIRELNGMVKLINNRIGRVNRLTAYLEDSNRALDASKQELELLSTTDPLTGCFNRRELMRRLNEEILRVSRQGGDLSFLCFDIDHFKAVNDTYGHPMGDAVLRSLADVVRSRLRASDCFCRSGGEEFALVLPVCDPEAARGYGELLRLSVASHTTHHNGQAVKVTLSIGIASFRPDDDADQLMARCDQALYRAKETGRDQVVVAP
ncbi:GGDEF domain-containing protein [Cyanobium sp. Morenito 9A2]|uniref:GGDEF domain-containing protein n=1 Tax=Cyanobium sp. Morenito 9A2 TaxID=2823718 RepID=UPI0020CD3287|nr:GGDEF domain-containing protein [Cyanobium sp. Morenito 9A2]MCP9850968.1 GGDEF domain-containing protein [Cyanobium sp. Morenito 9A2]